MMNQSGGMMDGADSMMWGMGFVGVLGVVLAILAIAALIKYLLFAPRRGRNDG